MEVIHYTVVLLCGILMLGFPGVLICRHWTGNLLFKVVTAIYTSLSFWVCAAFYISWVHLSLKYTFFIVELLSVIAWCFLGFKHFKGFPKVLVQRLKAVPVHYVILFAALVVYFFPFFFITLPPGNDTVMHGYITRLVINSDGMPNSYRPILPVNDFGSYSAGYHILTALVSLVDVSYLRPAINFMSVAIYPISLLGMVFFFSRFFTERTAVYTAIVAMGIARPVQSAIGWGGNSTILSVALCLFSIGILTYAVQNRSRVVFLIASLCIAAIPLIHLIPCIILFYISMPLYCTLIYYYSGSAMWIIRNTVILLFLVSLLLLPFLVHFKNEHSPELTAMIKHWQMEMMSNTLTNNFWHNVAATIDQAKYRMGDVLTILAGVSFVCLLLFRKAKPALLILGLIACILLLILNSGYWVLPFSELLYPERIMLFLVIGVAMLFGLFLDVLFAKQLSFRLFARRVTWFQVVSLTVVIVACVEIPNGYCARLFSGNNVQCSASDLSAFQWINRNTEKDAVFAVSYGDAGMWTPTFTNRATIGTHLHFIHLVKHIDDSLLRMNGPKYFLITPNDVNTHSKLYEDVKNKAEVFNNGYFRIYK